MDSSKSAEAQLHARTQPATTPAPQRSRSSSYCSDTLNKRHTALNPKQNSFLLTLYALQEHVTCPSDELVVPEDTAQLAAAIKSLRARAAAEGRPLKMRPARRGFATMASFACGPQPTLVNPFLVDGKKPMVVG